MKYFALLSKGTEEYFLLELKKFGVVGNIFNEYVTFEVEDIATLAYHCFIPKKICRVLSEGTLPITEYKAELSGETFGIRLHHPIDLDISKTILESEIGSKTKSDLSVNLKNPDNWIIAFVNDKDYIIGVDITGQDLDKRPYKVFNNSQAIKGNIAAATLYFAGYDGSQNILDPFCRSGEIPIEAGLIASGLSPWRYKAEFTHLEKPEFITREVNNKIYCFDELLTNLNASKKNAKLAGIEKFLSFSRIETSWLDTKLGEKSVNLIVTQPPIINDHNKKSKSQIEEIFYQSKYVLEGKIVFVTIMDESNFEMAKKYDFKLSKKGFVYSGKLKYNLLMFTNNI